MHDYPTHGESKIAYEESNLAPMRRSGEGDPTGSPADYSDE
jgi:hypothetical protein